MLFVLKEILSDVCELAVGSNVHLIFRASRYLHCVENHACLPSTLVYVHRSVVSLFVLRALYSAYNRSTSLLN